MSPKSTFPPFPLSRFSLGQSKHHLGYDSSGYSSPSSLFSLPNDLHHPQDSFFSPWAASPDPCNLTLSLRLGKTTGIEYYSTGVFTAGPREEMGPPAAPASASSCTHGGRPVPQPQAMSQIDICRNRWSCGRCGICVSRRLQVVLGSISAGTPPLPSSQTLDLNQTTISPR